MATLVTIGQEGPTDWHNPAWVVAVMLHPHEAVLLSKIRDGTLDLIGPIDAVREHRTEAARNGIVAGHVLSVLYALAQSPWHIPEPSLGKSIDVTRRFADEETYADGTPMPRGHTEVRKCFDAMRPVSHLWAAFILHREYPTRPHDELLRSDDGVHTLLRIARALQTWALTWRPKRVNRRQYVSLLGERAWLVPDEYEPLRPPWTHEPDWLLKTISRYARRTR